MCRFRVCPGCLRKRAIQSHLRGRGFEPITDLAAANPGGNSNCYNEWSIPFTVAGDEAWLIHTATHVQALRVNFLAGLTGYQPNFQDEWVMVDAVTGNTWALTNFFLQGSPLDIAFNY